MKLEIGNFHVADIQFGEKTVYENGVLIVNKDEAIRVLNKDGNLKNIEMHIARPGENVRILPIKTIVEPRFRPDGRSAFPGFTGPVAFSGEGITYALKDMAIDGVGRCSVNGVSTMLDMSGPGAELSPESGIRHLLFVADNADPEDDTPQRENKHYVKAAHYLAEYIGAVTAGMEPDDWERYNWQELSDSDLPRVGFLCQHWNLPNWTESTAYYGYELQAVPTTVVKPLECLDGAVIGKGGAIPGNAIRNTYMYQTSPLVKRLLAEHGKTINFVCMVLTGHIEPIDQKKQYAHIITSLATSLKLDAAVCLESHCGNVDVDYMMTVANLEDQGVKTVGILAENNGRDGRNPGKTYADVKANAIVSTGNACEVYELPAMDVVYGDLYSIGRDPYWGAWRASDIYGPSLREDGSLIVDAHMFMDHDGLLGTSERIVVDF